MNAFLVSVVIGLFILIGFYTLLGTVVTMLLRQSGEVNHSFWAVFIKWPCYLIESWKDEDENNIPIH